MKPDHQFMIPDAENPTNQCKMASIQQPSAFILSKDALSNFRTTSQSTLSNDIETQLSRFSLTTNSCHPPEKHEISGLKIPKIPDKNPFDILDYGISPTNSHCMDDSQTLKVAVDDILTPVQITKLYQRFYDELARESSPSAQEMFQLLVNEIQMLYTSRADMTAEIAAVCLEKLEELVVERKRSEEKYQACIKRLMEEKLELKKRVMEQDGVIRALQCHLAVEGGSRRNSLSRASI
ncbi:hypothetical protein BZA77DRAFT_366031 [Pyronema omphalodes]|nr:hypothetical protein BZA77DRAFT_366031 [Pyronema omphalodes]